MLIVFTILFLTTPTDPPLLSQANTHFQHQQYQVALSEYSYLLYRKNEYKLSVAQQKEISVKAAYLAMLNADEQAALAFISEVNKLIKNAPDSSILLQDKNLEILTTYISILSLVKTDPNLALIRAIRFTPENEIGKKYRQLLISYTHFKNGNTKRFLENYTIYCEMTPCLTIPESPEKQKSTKIARNLSTVIPGSGQIYGGDAASGLGAIGLNGLGLFFTGKALTEDRPVDAGLIGFLLLYRYYIGNIEAAQISVIDYNNRYLDSMKNQQALTLDVELEYLHESLYHSLLHFSYL